MSKTDNHKPAKPEMVMPVPTVEAIDWKLEDEEKLAEATKDIMDYLNTADAKNIWYAKQVFKKKIKQVIAEEIKKKFHVKDTFAKTVKANVKAGVKTAVDEVSGGAISAIEFGKDFVGTMMDMRNKANTAALLSTPSAKDKAKADDSKPYNYLVAALKDVLEGDAKAAERKLFIQWYVQMGSMAVNAATAGSSMHGNEYVAKGLDKLIEEGEATVDKVATELSEHWMPEIKKFLKDDAKLDVMKHGAVPWMYYLCAPPRSQITEIENCRLAVRISAGMPIDGYIAQSATDKLTVYLHPQRGLRKPPNPKDIVKLFSDVRNADPKKGRKALVDFQANHGHLNYIHVFLLGMGQEERFQNDPLILDAPATK